MASMNETRIRAAWHDFLVSGANFDWTNGVPLRLPAKSNLELTAYSPEDDATSADVDVVEFHEQHGTFEGERWAKTVGKFRGTESVVNEEPL